MGGRSEAVATARQADVRARLVRQTDCSLECAVTRPDDEDTREWVARAASAGIRDVWIHMGRETPEALKVAKENGVRVRSGTCAWI